MKKAIALFSSLLVLAGVKAQTVQVKKETIKADSVKQLSPTVAPAKTVKGFKESPVASTDYIKKTNQVDVKNTKSAIDTHIKH